MDGLGHLVSLTEQDPATGGLTQATTYAYDALDNLKTVSQGGQARSFVYDGLSRLASQTTPEAGTVSYTYWDSGDVKKRTDARNVETHYSYDALNRPQKVWYTGLGGSDDGTVRPALPAGVSATSDVQLTYNNYTTAQAGNGQLNSLANAAADESRYAGRMVGLDGRKAKAQHP